MMTVISSVMSFIFSHSSHYLAKWLIDDTDVKNGQYSNLQSKCLYSGKIEGLVNVWHCVIANIYDIFLHFQPFQPVFN